MAPTTHQPNDLETGSMAIEAHLRDIYKDTPQKIQLIILCMIVLVAVSSCDEETVNTRAIAKDADPVSCSKRWQSVLFCANFVRHSDHDDHPPSKQRE